MSIESSVLGRPNSMLVESSVIDRPDNMLVECNLLYRFNSIIKVKSSSSEQSRLEAEGTGAGELTSAQGDRVRAHICAM